MVNKLEAFEMWLYRRILKISWVQKKTNEEVLQLVCQERTLIKEIIKRKLNYFGHTARHDSLSKALLEGCVEGTRRRGRQRTSWFQNIQEWTGLGYAECARLAQNRSRWKSMVANLLKKWAR